MEGPSTVIPTGLRPEGSRVGVMRVSRSRDPSEQSSVGMTTLERTTPYRRRARAIACKSRERERVGLPNGKPLPDGRVSFRRAYMRLPWETTEGPPPLPHSWVLPYHGAVTIRPPSEPPCRHDCADR